ncbi:MAG TPA: universal stress protein [Nitrospinae bacterium]|nr:universal stress protein [Nitrospinota bacterium]
MGYENSPGLAPVDFSAASRDELGYAIELAGECGAELIALHVIPPYVAEMYAQKGTDWGAFRAEIEKKLHALVGKEAANNQAAGIHHRWCVVSGNPANEILRVAKREKADLVIMSTHGRSGIPRAVMGSVAEKVIRQSTVPVLTLSQAGMSKAA